MTHHVHTPENRSDPTSPCTHPGPACGLTAPGEHPDLDWRVLERVRRVLVAVEHVSQPTAQHDFGKRWPACKCVACYVQPVRAEIDAVLEGKR